MPAPNLPSLLFLLALCAVSTLAQQLSTVLRDEGFTEFAQALQGDPGLATGPIGPGAIVYAPTNAAILSNGNASVTRRDSEDDDDAKELKRQYYFTREAAAILKRHALVSPGAAYQTFLDDPALVNLGPGQNQTIVQRQLNSTALPVIYAGLGASVNVTAKDIPFDGGVIRPIDGILPVPRNLSRTLSFLNVPAFQAALKKTGLLEDLDSRARITVLAPRDDAFTATSSWTDTQLAQTLKNHILVDFPGYTPLLKDGSSFRTLGGANVTVSLRSGSSYINGARIVAGNAIIQNGVVHTMDKLLDTPVTTLTAAATVVEPTSYQTLVYTFIGIAAAALFA